MVKHLLNMKRMTEAELNGLVKRAKELKTGWKNNDRPRPLIDKTVAMIFEKPSTRTRVSFETGINQLGGKPIFMTSHDSQISRSEPAKDTARVMSRYVDALVVRTFQQAVLEELAAFASIPVINALTDEYHPCQVLSDLLTVQEHFGKIKGLNFCWLGDGNNMANSWLEAAGVLKLSLTLACPENYQPDKKIVAEAQAKGADILLTNNPVEAISKADVVNTDVWSSMGWEQEVAIRFQAFAGFMLDENLLKLASPQAIVLHCLPAHRGEEISEEVLEGKQSKVWDQAENRLHMQKAILEHVMS